MAWESFIPYVYATVSFIVIVLLYIAYCSWRIKRMIKNEIENQQYQD